MRNIDGLPTVTSILAVRVDGLVPSSAPVMFLTIVFCKSIFSSSSPEFLLSVTVASNSEYHA